MRGRFGQAERSNYMHTHTTTLTHTHIQPHTHRPLATRCSRLQHPWRRQVVLTYQTSKQRV